ncbi:MAG: hypothetical protein HND52_12655 [Ignavibacteriae bacterium]|nr:hypothetical protein [Ignavibacteriota bacterium]NOG98801.1 hypothetical protein [Ignavibacteriota bacterium]
MDLIELSKLLFDEKAVESYLRSIGMLKTFKHCLYCSSESLGRIRRGKIKCYKCTREWNRRKGSLLEGINIDLKKVLLFIKLIDYDFNNNKIQTELRMDRITIIKLRKRLKNKGG